MKTIPLGKCRGDKNRLCHFAVVDDSHYEMLTKYTWYKASAKGNSYAVAMIPNETGIKRTFMHRVIMKCVEDAGKFVDHKDGNGLNNTGGNLRMATNQENCRNRKIKNSTGYKGVQPKCKKFKASITIDGKPIHLGTFETPELAAIARDKASIKYFGEFARLNFPLR